MDGIVFQSIIFFESKFINIIYFQIEFHQCVILKYQKRSQELANQMRQIHLVIKVFLRSKIIFIKFNSKGDDNSGFSSGGFSSGFSSGGGGFNRKPSLDNSFGGKPRRCKEKFILKNKF